MSQSLAELVADQTTEFRRPLKYRVLRCSCGMATRVKCDLCGSARCEACSGRVRVNGKRGRAHLRCMVAKNGMRSLHTCLANL